MTAEQKNASLVKAIKIFLVESNYSKEDIARALGIHLNTLRNKMRNPDTFTYFELKQLIKLIKLTEDQKAMLL